MKKTKAKTTKSKAKEPIAQQVVLTLGIYFIDRFNYGDLCDKANAGDAQSRDLYAALESFIDNKPPAFCPFCTRTHQRGDSPTYTIFRLNDDQKMVSHFMTLMICEECAASDELDDKLMTVFHAWPAAPKNAQVEMIDHDRVLH